MKLRICALTLAVILVFSMGVSAQADPYTLLNNMKVEVVGMTDYCYDGEEVEVKVSLSDVSDYVIGTSQWYVNGTPVEGWYSSDYDLFVGKETTFRYTPVFEKGMKSTLNIAFDIAYGGYLKRTEIPAVTLHAYSDEYYDTRELKNNVQTVFVETKILRDTPTYTTKYLKTQNGMLSAGTTVCYVDRYSTTDDNDITTLHAGYVLRPDGVHAWVPHSVLQTSTKNYTDAVDYDTKTKEAFVNTKGYESETGYLVWISLKKQKVNVFMGQKGAWQYINSFSCATGKNTTPTPKGEYTYCARQNAWVHKTYRVGPVLYMDLSRGIAMHSWLYSPDGKYVIDSTIGRPASLGCVRLAGNDIAWLDYYLTRNTKVVVY